MYSFTIGLLVSTPDLWEEIQAAIQNLPLRVAFEMAAMDSASVLVDKVDRYRPDILLVDATAQEGRLAELVGAVRSSTAAPRVVVLDVASDPQRILAAMRAGASEYVYPPFADALKEALERLSGEFDVRARDAAELQKGRAFGFLSAKGGCGATTLACHAAVELHTLTRKEAILADLDLGSGLIRFLMQSKTRYSVLDAMRNVDRLDRSYWEGLVSNGHPGLEVLSGPLDESTRELPQVHDIRHVLRFARSHYPWLVADLGHGLNPLTWQAVEEIDELVLVSTMEIPALHRAKTIARQLRDAGFDKERLRFVLNRVPRKNEVRTEELESALGLKVFDTVPNDYRALEEAYGEGRLLNSDHALRQRISGIVAKLTGTQQNSRPRGRFKIFG
jgi:pilus assembly protein CpaE